MHHCTCFIVVLNKDNNVRLPAIFPFIPSPLSPAVALVLYCSRLHFLFILSMLYSLLSLFSFFHPVFTRFLFSFPVSLPPFCCFTCLMVKFDICNVMMLLVLPVLICGYVSNFQYTFICLYVRIDRILHFSCFMRGLNIY